jgi:hypothetical protein
MWSSTMFEFNPLFWGHAALPLKHVFCFPAKFFFLHGYSLL